MSKNRSHHPSLITHSYLGIDFGTSGARAALIDAHGEQLAEARCAFAAVAPERLAESWQTALFQLLEQIPVHHRQNIKAIAIDGTSATALLCDADMHPLCPPLLYNDSRAAAQAGQLAAIAPPGHTVLGATSSLAKLLWFAAQPEFPQARYFVHQADWLASLLHGRPGIGDYHNSLKLGYDAEHLRYPGWLLALPVARVLPHVIAPGTPIGPVLPEIARRYSLPGDCLVRAGTTDSIAAFLASGASQPGDAVTSLGSTLVLKLLSARRIEAAEYGIYSHR
ncbi:MAG: carbohydrate kinase, partial [Sulfuricellaceae bacterium]|nr:carbohydrate kinase [Sulfuricellaceae bacterium]